MKASELRKASRLQEKLDNALQSLHHLQKVERTAGYLEFEGCIDLRDGDHDCFASVDLSIDQDNSADLMPVLFSYFGRLVEKLEDELKALGVDTRDIREEVARRIKEEKSEDEEEEEDEDDMPF